MPDAGRQREQAKHAAADDEAGRLADHAGIARLTDELLPALIAKLSSTQLGEIEVREGEWHVRLRRPAGGPNGEGRRATDKPSRAQPGHEGHGHSRAGVEGQRGGRSSSGGGASGAASGGATNGTGGATRGGPHDGEGPAERSRIVATSPAVGIFQPGPRAVSGTRVRAGDSLGHVDVLGVPQEIASPADGIVGSTLVEAGMAVEYGQELIRLELTATAASAEAR